MTSSNDCPIFNTNNQIQIHLTERESKPEGEEVNHNERNRQRINSYEGFINLFPDLKRESKHSQFTIRQIDEVEYANNFNYTFTTICRNDFDNECDIYIDTYQCQRQSDDGEKVYYIINTILEG